MAAGQPGSAGRMYKLVVGTAAVISLIKSYNVTLRTWGGGVRLKRNSIVDRCVLK